MKKNKNRTIKRIKELIIEKIELEDKLEAIDLETNELEEELQELEDKEESEDCEYNTDSIYALLETNELEAEDLYKQIKVIEKKIKYLRKRK